MHTKRSVLQAQAEPFPISTFALPLVLTHRTLISILIPCPNPKPAPSPTPSLTPNPAGQVLDAFKETGREPALAGAIAVALERMVFLPGDLTGACESACGI